MHPGEGLCVRAGQKLRKILESAVAARYLTLDVLIVIPFSDLGSKLERMFTV